MIFTQRRIRAAFAAIAAHASRLPILVVRPSLPQSRGTSGRICKAEKSKTQDRSDTQFVAGKPNSPWASETRNERHSKDGRLLRRDARGSLQRSSLPAARPACNRLELVGEFISPARPL